MIELTDADDGLLTAATARLAILRRNEEINLSLNKLLPREATTLKKSLGGVFEQLKKEHKFSAVATEVATAWHNTVSQTISNSTETVKYKNGFLYIEISNLIIKNEIENFLADELLLNLREKLPQYLLRGIKVKVGKNKKFRA